MVKSLKNNYEDMGYTLVTFREYMLITGKWVNDGVHEYGQSYDGEIYWTNKKTGRKVAFRKKDEETNMMNNYVKGDCIGRY